ncbi:MAG: RnfABCDGE type electron transport complex subunit G [Pseudomonas sp.]|uniref:RnfABCDGE type electron transport complex subunit G n=1 Tax=Pseudomonas sp. TaxID=306 RepID=UPI003D0EF1D0
MNSRMRQALTLSVLILLGAGVLVALQHWATPRIEQQRLETAERALLDLLAPGSYDNHPLRQPIALPAGSLLGNTQPAQAYQARLGDRLTAVLLPVHAKGYEGPILLLVAVAPDGRLIASKVLEQRETPGLGNLIERHRSPWLQGFDGKSLEDAPATWTLRAEGGQFDQIAGATVTSRSVTEALQRALRFFEEQRPRLLEAPSHD